MPNINIKERDLTTNNFIASTTNTLFVAVSALSQATYTISETTVTESFATPKFITSVTKSGTIYTVTADEVEYTVSAEAAVEGLDFVSQALGLGGQVYAAAEYGTTSTGAIPYISDRNQFDIKFLISDESTLSEALTVAQARKDAAVILATTSEHVTSATASLCSAAISYASGFYKDERVAYAGKYVIPFYGKDLEGRFTNPAYCAVLAYLNSVNKGNAEWLPVAGYSRGEIPGATKAGFLTEAELNSMQPKTIKSGSTSVDYVSVNPICNVNPWGVRIWGNRTALPIDLTGATSTTNKLVASSFANIRVLLCDLKKAMYVASKKYQFEQNTDVLWVNFTSEINSTLEVMKNTYGIAAYRWVRETPERATINAKLQIIPIEGVEDFNLTVELTDELLEVAE